MEASLHSIATADPEAKVDVVVYSEGQWGGMVDEMGVPLEWDVPGEVCEELGLHCTQVRTTTDDRRREKINLTTKNEEKTGWRWREGLKYKYIKAFRHLFM